MATKAEKLGGKETAVVLAVAVFALNWLSAKYLDFSFAWCWGLSLGPIFEPWVFLIHIIALAYFVVAVLRQDILRIAGALLVVIIAFGLPMFLEILFRFGKSCS